MSVRGAEAVGGAIYSSIDTTRERFDRWVRDIEEGREESLISELNKILPSDPIHFQINNFLDLLKFQDRDSNTLLHLVLRANLEMLALAIVDKLSLMDLLKILEIKIKDEESVLDLVLKNFQHFNNLALKILAKINQLPTIESDHLGGNKAFIDHEGGDKTLIDLAILLESKAASEGLIREQPLQRKRNLVNMAENLMRNALRMDEPLDEKTVMRPTFVVKKALPCVISTALLAIAAYFSYLKSN